MIAFFRANPLQRLAISLITLSFLLQLTGCSGEGGFVRERRVDYRQARTLERLEVPPDLTQVEARGGGSLAPTSALGTATYSSFTSGQADETSKAGASLLPRPDSLRVEHDGARRWLVVEGEPEKIWPAVREFWLHQGFLIKREDPRLGIIETEWAENRADIPQGAIRRWLGKVFDFAYSAPTRDKYRVRMERGAQGNTTEIFLTHWGVKQVVIGGGPLSDPNSTVWDYRPSDPELEAEFLNRLVVYLGVGEEQASQRLATAPREPRARLVSGPGGGNVLDVDERYARAWRLTGIALDHLGFVVEDRDQQQGTYLVRSADPLTELTQKKGFFANLAFWRDDEQKSLEEVRFRILLTEAGAGTRVSVNPEKEATPTATKAAEKILALLEEQLR